MTALDILAALVLLAFVVALVVLLVRSPEARGLFSAACVIVGGALLIFWALVQLWIIR